MRCAGVAGARGGRLAGLQSRLPVPQLFVHERDRVSHGVARVTVGLRKCAGRQTDCLPVALGESGRRRIRGASIWWRCDPWLDGRDPDLRRAAAGPLARQPWSVGIDADAVCVCSVRVRADLDLAHRTEAAPVEAHRERRASRVRLRGAAEGISAHGGARAAAVSRHRAESDRIASGRVERCLPRPRTRRRYLHRDADPGAHRRSVSFDARDELFRRMVERAHPARDVRPLPMAGRMALRSGVAGQHRCGRAHICRHRHDSEADPRVGGGAPHGGNLLGGDDPAMVLQ